MTDIIQRTTIHGVQHIFGSKKNISKFIWVILFLFGIIAIGINIVIVTMKYLSNPVLMNIDSEYKRFTFPDLTFCNPSAPFSFENNLSLQHWINITNVSQKILKKLQFQEHLVYFVYVKEVSHQDFIEMLMSMSSFNPSILNKYYYNQTIKLLDAVISVKYYNRTSTNSFKIEFTTAYQNITTSFVSYDCNVPCFTIRWDKSFEKYKFNFKKLFLEIKFNFKSHMIFNSDIGHRSIFLYIQEPNTIPGLKAINLIPGYRHKVVLTETFYRYKNI